MAKYRVVVTFHVPYKDFSGFGVVVTKGPDGSSFEADSATLDQIKAMMYRAHGRGDFSDEQSVHEWGRLKGRSAAANHATIKKQPPPSDGDIEFVYESVPDPTAS